MVFLRNEPKPKSEKHGHARPRPQERAQEPAHVPPHGFATGVFRRYNQSHAIMRRRELLLAVSGGLVALAGVVFARGLLLPEKLHDLEVRVQPDRLAADGHQSAILTIHAALP